MKTKEPKSKIALLSDARDKKTKNDAAARGSILLDKSERREVQGFKARQREVDAVVAPLNQDVREFLAELQEKYGVTFGTTHNMDFENLSIEPIPEKPDEPKAEA